MDKFGDVIKHFSTPTITSDHFLHLPNPIARMLSAHTDLTANPPPSVFRPHGRGQFPGDVTVISYRWGHDAGASSFVVFFQPSGDEGGWTTVSARVARFGQVPDASPDITSQM